MARLLAGSTRSEVVTVTNGSFGAGVPVGATLSIGVQAGLIGRSSLLLNKSTSPFFGPNEAAQTFWGLTIPPDALGASGLVVAQIFSPLGARIASSWKPLQIVSDLGALPPFTPRDVQWAADGAQFGDYHRVINDYYARGLLTEAIYQLYFDAMLKASERFDREGRVILGDVNGDGLVDVGDVTALKINILNGYGDIDLDGGVSILDIYEIEWMLMGVKPVQLQADVNGDGVVDLGDVLALVEYMRRADVNGDGWVDVGDVTAIKNLILGA